jgi:hypothetical protein
MRQKKVYDAEMAVRIVEANQDLTSRMRPPQHYLNLIWSVFLSGTNLKKIILRHKIYQDKWDRDPQLAVEAMRDDMDVRVWRNYFVEDYYSHDDDEARSARVAITWHYKDPDIALEVVRDLGNTIMESQSEERRAVFEAAQLDIEEAADAQYERLVALRRTIERKKQALDRASGVKQAQLLVQVTQLSLEEKQLAKDVASLSTQRTAFELSVASEKNSSGLRFEMIEPGVVTAEAAGGPITIGVTTAAVFFLALFLGGVLVGAFEYKVRQAADVRRLGIRVLGAVPPFQGDGVGALAERLRAEDRLRLERP